MKIYENIFFCKSGKNLWIEKSKKICFFSAQLKVRIYHNLFSAIVNTSKFSWFQLKKM